MKCSECGNEIFELNESSERWLWCPICGHEEKLKDEIICEECAKYLGNRLVSTA